jgi:hypothetical protein
VGKGSGQNPQIRDAAQRLGRKELNEAATVLNRNLNIGRCGYTWGKVKSLLPCRPQHARIAARSHPESRPGLARCSKLVAAEDGADSCHHFWNLSPNCAEGVKRSWGSQSQFHHADTPLGQCAGQRHSVMDILDNQNRNNPGGHNFVLQ